jgi:DNA-binding NarL/FixJ family response regulator
MPSDPFTVAIVEDSPGLRRNLETILQRAEGFQCVGSFEDGEQAVAALPALRPQVVLMDINLPGMNGVQCVERLARDLTGTHMIMITVYDDTDAIFDSLAAGAGGYLLKPVRSAQLVAAIYEKLHVHSRAQAVAKYHGG